VHVPSARTTWRHLQPARLWLSTPPHASALHAAWWGNSQGGVRFDGLAVIDRLDEMCKDLNTASVPCARRRRQASPSPVLMRGRAPTDRRHEYEHTPIHIHIHMPRARRRRQPLHQRRSETPLAPPTPGVPRAAAIPHASAAPRGHLRPGCPNTSEPEHRQYSPLAKHQ
jgi:hypothetical protein